MTKWTYVRVRKRGEPDWLDPNADIRKLLPVVALQAIDVIENMYPEGSKEYRDALYIQNCIRIFQLRVLEDKECITDQVKEFIDATGRVDAKVRALWVRYVVMGMLTIYGLFCRRDSVTDRAALDAMRNYAASSVLSDALQGDMLNDVRKTLQATKLPEVVEQDASVLCENTGHYIECIKEIACKALGVVGGDDWNTMADLCDKRFSTPDIKSDVEGVALALAYPTYDHPTMVVSVKDKNGPGPEDKEPEKTGEPGTL